MAARARWTSEQGVVDGVDNRVFGVDDSDDANPNMITSWSSQQSDLHQAGSQHLLTTADTNLRGRGTGAAGPETIELAPSSTSGNDLRKRQRYDSNVSSSGRSGTPINMVRRWSQSISRFSKDKRSIREKTIYRLPSRKICEIDGKLLSAANDEEDDVEIEQMALEIEQHESLMQDTVLGKQNRLETLRALPQPLATKCQLKKKLAVAIEQQSADVQRHQHWRKYAFNASACLVFKLWAWLRLLCNGAEIWYSALKTIEGHFGSAVGSYFRFLRWLLVLNVILFICIFSFIALPQILYDSLSRREIEVGTRAISDVVAVNATSTTMALIEEIPPDTSWLAEEKNNATSRKWKFLDFLTGQGRMRMSLMFYGGYTNETISLKNSQHSYSLPHAYYMTMLMLYLTTFVVISTSMARSYRKSFIETSDGMRSVYALKIFCSWDFGISNHKAAELKHFTIFTELKEVLSEIDERKQKLPLLWRIWSFCSQLAAHLLIGAMIAGLSIAIYILLREFGESSEASSWTTVYVATFVNVSMLLLQTVFSWISKLEGYRSPRNAFHVTLVRNFLLEAAIIGIFIYFWLTKQYGECWETSIGQEIYRLIVSDLFIRLLVVPLFSGIRILITIRFWPQFDRPEFDISQKSLGLVFNQTLLWVGLLFAPLLSAVMVLKLVLMFYVKQAMLLHLCKSPRHIWRSAQTHTLYLVFTFLSLLGVIIALGYIMTQVPVSPNCGPFRDYAFMFQIFIDGVLKLRENQTIWRLLMTLIRPAVVGGILIIMAIMVYYLRAKSRARCLMVKLLKEMLYLEAKDKEFLLANITNITKDREWQFEESSDLEDLQPPPESTAAASSGQGQGPNQENWCYARMRMPSHSRVEESTTTSLRSCSSGVSADDEIVQIIA